ncbi:MAG: hypothetical protein M1838_002004 [Thelocarpon superellum]|nr:MAG: hypothetical protein M1838_002004 [Thelocarpon superellum]
MDDLAGLDWSNQSTAASTRPTSTASTSFYPPLRPSPSPSISGRSTPASTMTPASLGGSAASSRPASKLASNNTDSFSNLVSFQPSKTSSSLTLQEKQRRLEEERSRQEAAKQKAFDDQFGARDATAWDALDRSRATPDLPTSRLQVDDTDDDFLAAFSARAKVDSSTNFSPATTGRPAQATDDDPFGLGHMTSPTGRPTRELPADDADDDVLGLLGKPVSEIRPPSSSLLPASDPQVQRSRPAEDDSSQGAVTELVDMGFPASKAREALAATESGQDVQAAVGWLLSEAHRASKQQSQHKNVRASLGHPDDDASSAGVTAAGPNPLWMRQNEPSRSTARANGSSAVYGEKDVGTYASEVGSQLFKSANALWTTGRKKVQKAVTELQSDGDPSQPKWMREAHAHDTTPRRPARADEPTGSHGARQKSPLHAEAREATNSSREKDITDEALMLEARAGRPAAKQQARSEKPKPQPPRSLEGARRDSPSAFPDDGPRGRERPTPDTRQPPTRVLELDARAKLSRQANEEQSAQSYVSPARRKKPVATGAPAGPRFGLLPIAPEQPKKARTEDRHTPASTGTHSVSIPTRPRAPVRQIPPVSAAALSTSASQRHKGTEAFKRGDFASSHTFYSSALAPLPPRHPVAIIVLCNRALVNLKVGDSKAAVADAEQVLAIIGVSHGDNEQIMLGGGEGTKEMRDYFGKALMRKAEALEHMEKWPEAGKAWKEAVEAGVGGSTSIQGRDRCEKAAGLGNGSARAPTRPAPTISRKGAPRASTRPGASVISRESAEAVSRLREANAAAEKVDDEKFALADSVDARLTAWKGGKQDNLRALLGSLDAVLWPEAGWKKVGMHELVLPNKVKVVYMKGIAKVHPDKLALTATTEQRMISGAVFSTLNEAWDRFKQENNL